MQSWRRFLTQLWRMVLYLILTALIVAALPFTPIFANISVFFLDAFSGVTLSSPKEPIAITVLGGGLARDDGRIILNHYSQSRINSTYQLHKDIGLPIITSGVESPWFDDYLSSLRKSVTASDNASMNTCENAIFTAKLLDHHELPKSIYLVTDRYHMARARRQFARAGVDTTPYPAPLFMPLRWRDPKNNLIHSRRAIYEIAALARDIFHPQENCRTADQITLEEIGTPRRKPTIFSHN
ncbi:YdcF family protein [Moraxella bovoculi]|uniref:YdcF family protein n=1 Tax=Moraxella bovoculi TaxID=386891 RepID=UPI003F4FD359